MGPDVVWFLMFDFEYRVDRFHAFAPRVHALPCGVCILGVNTHTSVTIDVLRD